MKRCLLLLAGLLIGCDSDDEKGVKFLPINPKELMYHKGDVLAFTVDNDSLTTGAAIVLNYLKEEGDETHIWYELVCTDYLTKPIPTLEQLKHHRLFGRKVASTVDPDGYYIGLDVESVRNDCLANNADKFHLVGRLPLDTTAWKLGSQGATSSYKQFVDSFLYGREKRLLPPDHYTEHFKLDDFRPDEYFPIRNYLLK